jgi:glycosyltransferase involved in cell wall biosynthesis
VIGYLGRLDRLKGIRYLLEALRLLVTEGHDLQGILVGGGDLEWVRSQISRLDLMSHVRMIGHVSDPAPYLGCMDVLAHPSLSEALPQVLLEAAAAGTPIVATRVGGIPEIVEDGHSALLVAPRDVSGLVAALRTLSFDADLRGALAEAAATRVEERFSSSMMVERHVELYERLLRET